MIDYALKYSLKNKVPVTIIYQKGLEISKRRIRVIKIENDKIVAYCYKRKANRIFKEKNILAATILGTERIIK